MTWKETDPQGAESAKCRWDVVRYTRGKGLDVGCGPWKQFPHWIGVDNRADTQLFGVQMDPDVMVETAEDLSLFASGSLDFVFSSHLLEHIAYEKVPATLKEWLRVLKVGGYLVLYLPDEDQYPKVGEHGANPDHKWNVNYDRVLEAMSGSWDLVKFEKRDQGMEYSLLFVFKKTQGVARAFSYKNPKPEKTAGVVRYGAIGDLIQASSVLAGLKKQGYHITLYCSPPQCDVVAHDPNVDDFYYQDKDQVPNHYLAEFWANESKKYDKWVNLSESVEGSFLALPTRALHGWPPALRHRLMNMNYLEAQHMLAGVPHVPEVRFYPTKAEEEWARKQRARMGEFLICWPLAGSSVHKKWHGLDNIIAATLLHFPQVHFCLMGGPGDAVYEAGWEKEPRVHCSAGKFSIRESLSLILQADMLIGPETGLMNAASQLQAPKVVFLSHSTHENLTRDWTNVHPIWSGHTVCPGRGNNEAPACHQLHYTWEHCKQDKGTGVAQCMADLDPAEVYKVVWHCITWALEAKAA